MVQSQPKPQKSDHCDTYAVFCWPFFPMRDLWMWGMTPGGMKKRGWEKHFWKSSWGKSRMHMALNIPPPAIVALMRESNSSSPRMASCKWRGVIRFTFKSLEALPANSRTWGKRGAQSSTVALLYASHDDHLNTYFSGEVLKDGGTVHSCRGSDATVAGRASFQVSVDTTHWKLAGKWKRQRMRYAKYLQWDWHADGWAPTWRPALWERDTALALALPLSFPALPPACRHEVRLQFSNQAPNSIQATFSRLKEDRKRVGEG